MTRIEGCTDGHVFNWIFTVRLAKTWDVPRGTSPMDVQMTDTFHFTGRTADPVDRHRQDGSEQGGKNDKDDRADTLPLTFERAFWVDGLTRIAGIDEAGRGPLAGPVVASAVIFPVETYIPGVRDSKKLSEKKREFLYDEIMREALSVGIGIIGQGEIDRINILAATYKAMLMAIERLVVEPHHLLVDGRAIPGCPVNQLALIGGDDRCFSIAAASIMAKVTRDRMMMVYDCQFPQYGFARHKGYATAGHRAALRKHGPCKIHRRSFSWT